MKNSKLINIVTLLATSLIGLVVLLWWLTFNPVANFEENLPGQDNRPAHLSMSGDSVKIGEHFELYDSLATVIPGSWPRFRGADFDNIYKESVKLSNSWPESGPTELWSIDLGEGHAAPVIDNGRVYLLDYDEEKKADALKCFSLANGKMLWQRWYDVPMKRNHGLSRTIPAVANNSVLTLGPMCHVMCVTADSGNLKWGMDLVQNYGTEVPLWYTGQCPLIQDSLAILAPGGSSLLVAVDLDSGNVVWETPNPNNWQMSHSSIMPLTIHDTNMLIYCAIGGMVAVAADGENAGEILFETKEWDANVIAPSPILVDKDKIYVTAGYAAGSMLFQVEKENDSFSIKTLLDLKPDEGLASEQQTPILTDGFLYGILPKDAGEHRNQFICVKADEPDKIVWTSGQTHRYGLGPYILADNKFYILNDEGVLTMIEQSTTGFKQLGEAKVLDGHDAWGPFALVDGRLLARDSKRLVCLDLK